MRSTDDMERIVAVNHICCDKNVIICSLNSIEQLGRIKVVSFRGTLPTNG